MKRSWGTFGTILATGLSLAACTQQEGGAAADGRVARSATARGATLAGTFAGGRGRFAALPDRGELLRYDALSPVRDGADTWHRTELSERHALDAIGGGTLRVATPDGRVLGFRYDRSVRHDESGDWTWIGHLPGRDGVQAVLTFGAGAVYGSIGQPGAQPLRVAMRDGASWLVETGAARVADNSADSGSGDGLDAASAALRPRASLPTESVPMAATPTIDLLIGYTQGFVAAQGGAANAVTRLNNIVDTANAGLRARQVPGQIRLVHAMRVNYTDTNGNDVALAQLTGYDGDLHRGSTPNAAFDALRSAREQYGADLVALVRPHRNPEQSNCGIGWRAGTNARLVDGGRGRDFSGYAILGDGSDRNERDGTRRDCDGLLDQIAHAGDMQSISGFRSAKASATVLPAARHIDANGNGASDLFFFNHSTGSVVTWYMNGTTRTAYATSPVPGGYHVVAAGNFNDDHLEDLFLADADGHLYLGISNGATFATQTLPYVTPSRPVAAGDFDGDGQSDILLFDAASGKIATWFMRDGNRTAYTSQIVPSGLRFVATGDFNADAMADLLFESPQGSLYVAISRGTIFLMRATGLTHSSAYATRGLVDVNGDGRTDVLLHDPVANRLVVWYMDSATRIAYNSSASPVGAALVADGDFDRNGRGDVGWVDPASGQIWVSLSTGSTFTTTLLPYTFSAANANPMDIDL